MKFLKTNKARWTAVAVAGVLLTGGLLGLSARVSAQEKTKVLGVSAFSVGLLDDETGKLLTGDNKDDSGLSTDLYYKFDENFKVELVKDPTVEYALNFYDSEKDFVSCSGLYDYDIQYDELLCNEDSGDYRYVKIEIIPLEDNDEKVSWTEKAGYVNQLKVTVSK